jgi:hypothetical protein
VTATPGRAWRTAIERQLAGSMRPKRSPVLSVTSTL